MSNNTEKLLQITGFDPAKKPSITNNILKKAMAELEAARENEALDRARDILKKAVELRQQAFKAEQDFNRNKKKFEDELGKLISQLHAALEPGQEVAPETEETKSE